MLIELKNILKKYDENPKPVLDDITLEFPQGSTVAIVGPSGSGKSTLLNLIGTLDFPTSGEVFLDGKSTNSFTVEELVNVRSNKIGFVFQTHLLLPQLNVLENVLLPVLPKDKKQQKKAKERAVELLDAVGLTEKINSYPGKMSVGECQRVAVVRSLINNPDLLLTDEPTGSLDHDSAERLSDLLIKLQHQYSFTLITVTHSADLARRMDITYKLINGKLSAS